MICIKCGVNISSYPCSVCGYELSEQFFSLFPQTKLLNEGILTPKQKLDKTIDDYVKLRDEVLSLAQEKYKDGTADSLYVFEVELFIFESDNREKYWNHLSVDSKTTGKYLWHSGEEYLHNRANGLGKLTFHNGDIYNGNFLDGKRHGHGSYHLTNGEVYVGVWQDGWRYGYGKYRCPNSKVYEGFWKQGLRHGFGTQHNTDGSKQTGFWYEGNFIGDDLSGLSDDERNGFQQQRTQYIIQVNKANTHSGEQVNSTLSTAKNNNQTEDSVKIGGTIHFGYFDWYVLDIQDKKALILSKDIVEQRSYKSSQFHFSWEHSDIRKYLNEQFYHSFGPGKIHIIETPIVTSWKTRKNKVKYEKTKDMIFLLDFDDVYKYILLRREYDNVDFIPNNIDLIVNKALQFNFMITAHNEIKEPVWWWLRTQGNKKNHIAIVDYNGKVDYENGREENIIGGVRPAMWIKIDENNANLSVKKVASTDNLNRTANAVNQIVLNNTTIEQKSYKIGRNDPCPCGNKRPNGLPYKYKDCCGRDF